MKRWRVLAVLAAVAMAVAVLYAIGAFSGRGVKELRLGQAVRTGAFSFTPLRIECGKPLSVIPAKQRRGLPGVHGEICFAAVRLEGPNLHIPPLLVGAFMLSSSSTGALQT